MQMRAAKKTTATVGAGNRNGLVVAGGAGTNDAYAKFRQAQVSDNAGHDLCRYNVATKC